jgi:hypothetical protein
MLHCSNASNLNFLAISLEQIGEVKDQGTVETNDIKPIVIRI